MVKLFPKLCGIFSPDALPDDFSQSRIHNPSVGWRLINPLGHRDLKLWDSSFFTFLNPFVFFNLTLDCHLIAMNDQMRSLREPCWESVAFLRQPVELKLASCPTASSSSLESFKPEQFNVHYPRLTYSVLRRIWASLGPADEGRSKSWFAKIESLGCLKLLRSFLLRIFNLRRTEHRTKSSSAHCSFFGLSRNNYECCRLSFYLPVIPWENYVVL